MTAKSGISQEEFSPKIGNAFPTAWEIPLSIVVTDIVFFPPDLLQQECQSWFLDVPGVS
jgi:hypothetical protein